MAKFLLLLHDSPGDYAGWTPERMQECIEQYRAWSDGLLKAGKLAGSEKLKDEGGKHLRGKPGHVEVMDGPYSEAKEVLGGLFTILADDYEEAVEIARECPHLENGWIEVRQIDEV
jgi:hypothetical protein